MVQGGAAAARRFLRSALPRGAPIFNVKPQGMMEANTNAVARSVEELGSSPSTPKE